MSEIDDTILTNWLQEFEGRAETAHKSRAQYDLAAAIRRRLPPRPEIGAVKYCPADGTPYICRSARPRRNWWPLSLVGDTQVLNDAEVRDWPDCGNILRDLHPCAADQCILVVSKVDRDWLAAHPDSVGYEMMRVIGAARASQEREDERERGDA